MRMQITECLNRSSAPTCTHMRERHWLEAAQLGNNGSRPSSPLWVSGQLSVLFPGGPQKGLSQQIYLGNWWAMSAVQKKSQDVPAGDGHWHTPKVGWRQQAPVRRLRDRAEAAAWPQVLLPLALCWVTFGKLLSLSLMDLIRGR